MGKAQDTYTIDDLQSDAGHLQQLIEVITHMVIEDAPFVVPSDKEPGHRFDVMDRLNGLVWILRDQMETLNENIERHYFAIATSRSKPPSDDPTTIARFERWLELRGISGQEGDADERLAEYQNIQRELTAAPARSLRELAMQLVAETDDNDSDYRDEFYARVRSLAVPS